MKKKKAILFPKSLRMLEEVGENIKLARLRRKLSLVQVAERAGISRATLWAVEKGKPSVTIGAYFQVLNTLGLAQDVLLLAKDDFEPDYLLGVYDHNPLGGLRFKLNHARL